MTDEFSWEQVWQQLKGDTVDLIVNIIVIAIILLIANFIINRISKHTSRLMEKGKAMDDVEKGKELVSAMTIIRSISRYVIYFMAIILILNQIGYADSVNNILVTAGIGSLVISLAVQSTLQDMLAGLLVLFDKQYQVGDFVTINDYTGTVTAISMRLTYITNYEGKRIIIPNGQIKTVINYGNKFTLAKVVVPTPYEADSRRMIEILQEVMDEYAANTDVLVEKPNVLGITAYNSSSVDITIIAKTKPLKHWSVERELRLLIKERLEKEGISIPYQHIEIITSNEDHA